MPDHKRLLDATIPASDCAILVAAMDRAMRFFASLGMGPDKHGRFKQARELLLEIASADSYQVVPYSRAALSAIRLAADVQQLWLTVADARVDDLVREIRSIRGGTLEETGPRAPYQTQSQLFVGSLLALGGLDTEARAPHQKGPDNRVRPLLLGAAVEVKRPETEAGIAPNFKKALKQIDDAGDRGVIALDLSDCLSSEVFPSSVEMEGSDPWARGRPRFIELKGLVRGLIRTPPPNFRDIARVIGCFGFARGARWVRMRSGVVLPELFSAGWWEAYPHRGKTVWYWLGQRIRGHLELGLMRNGTVRYDE